MVWLPTEDEDCLINTDYLSKIYYVKLNDGKYHVRAERNNDTVYVYDLVCYDTEQEAKDYIKLAIDVLNPEIKRADYQNDLLTKVYNYMEAKKKKEKP